MTLARLLPRKLRDVLSTRSGAPKHFYVRWGPSPWVEQKRSVHLIDVEEGLLISWVFVWCFSLFWDTSSNNTRYGFILGADATGQLRRLDSNLGARGPHCICQQLSWLHVGAGAIMLDPSWAMLDPCILGLCWGYGSLNGSMLAHFEVLLDSWYLPSCSSPSGESQRSISPMEAVHRNGKIQSDPKKKANEKELTCGANWTRWGLLLCNFCM